MDPLRSLFNTSKLYSAWDVKHTPGVIITDNQRYIITLINNTVLCQFISLLGCITNVINMIVFYRQGLNTTINISFFSLAISDFCSLVLQQASNIFVNPLFVALDLPMVYGEVQYATARIGRSMFARITLFTTVYITAERCLCITLPLHIKQMITPRKAVVILFCIYSFTIAISLPLNSTFYIDSKFHSGRNMNVLGLMYRKHKRFGIAATYFLVAISGIIAFLIVLVLTLVLTWKLKEKSNWLKMSNARQEKSQSISQRDMATAEMVVIITSVLIVCYTPTTFFCLLTFIEPEIRQDGKYGNLYYCLWSIIMVAETINSSINIFFYFKMSSKYRKTFGDLFSACVCETRYKITAKPNKKENLPL